MAEVRAVDAYLLELSKSGYAGEPLFLPNENILNGIKPEQL